MADPESECVAKGLLVASGMQPDGLSTSGVPAIFTRFSGEQLAARATARRNPATTVAPMLLKETHSPHPMTPDSPIDASEEPLESSEGPTAESADTDAGGTSVAGAPEDLPEQSQTDDAEEPDAEPVASPPKRARSRPKPKTKAKKTAKRAPATKTRTVRAKGGNGKPAKKSRARGASARKAKRTPNRRKRRA
jgi:hypothetical protein